MGNPNDARTRQRVGLEEVAAALAAGEAIGGILVRRAGTDPALLRLIHAARERGIPIHETSEGDLRRLSAVDPPAPILALVGRDPSAAPEAAFETAGAKWLLVGAAYPGNVGAALRTVEIAGADAVFVDASLDRSGRRAALRTSMNVERFMPVHWVDAAAAVDLARAGGHRVVGIEDVGTVAPWEIDLLAPSLFMVGGEDQSLSSDLLDRCDHVIRLPMQGFIPCYNLQAAIAGVALERLRQAANRSGASSRPTPASP